MFGWLLRIALLLIVIRAISRLLHGIVRGMQAPPRSAAPQAVPLARDPVCGTFVVRSRAITAGEGPDLRFFCSESCRRAWIAPSRQ